MPSLFYKAAFDRRFPLSFLMLEDIGIRITELGSDPTAEEVAEAISCSLMKCGEVKKPSHDDISYASNRLEAIAREVEEADKAEGTGSKKKAFASSYSKWASALEPHAVCLLVAEYDIGKATHLYTKVDKDDVVEMSAQLMEKEWEKIRVGYESVVYGFGGGYDDKATVDVDVSTDDNAQGTAISSQALSAVKF